jgi:hypothetical protein
MRKAALVAVGIGIVSALLASTPPAATAAAADAPWGPPHVLHKGSVSTSVSQVTSSRGMVVAVFRETPHGGPTQVDAAVQLSGRQWGTPIPVSTGKVARPTAIAWGAGNVSVVWQTPAGTNKWLFHMRTVSPDGTWGATQKLTTATYAYPWFQAAINGTGELALAWVNGDNTDRVAIHHADGEWTFPPAVPVVHPTFQGTPFIANPLELFLNDSGQVTDVTWGKLGSSRRVVWKMRIGTDGVWHHQRIAPINGGVLGYGWVGQAHVAADSSGDFAAIWSQQDASTKHWTTMFRYWPATGAASAITVLSHVACGPDEDSCGDIGMTSDGSVLIAYAVPAGGKNVTVSFVRRAADGTFTTPQAVSDALWSAPYQGVRLSNNDRGDALLSFIGGGHQRSYSEFARCPASSACDQAVLRDNGPSWLDLWVTSVGPLGGSTVTWTYSFRAQAVTTRHLAAYDGAP